MMNRRVASHFLARTWQAMGNGRWLGGRLLQ
jgi:hypothetical protein